jgi:hypothetical protein
MLGLFCIIFLILGWGETESLGTWTANSMLYQPWIRDQKNEALGRMRIGRGNWSIRCML